MDLNILITTIITATAALVAIIGGFLVSRVLSLSSERGGIERRLREIRNDLSAKNEMLKRAEFVLLEEDAEDFIRDNYKDILFEGNSLEQIIDKDDYSNRTVEELKPYVKELKDIKNELIDIINTFESDILPQEFTEIVTIKADLKFPSKLELYELVYDFIIESLPEEQPENQFSWGNWGLPKINPKVLVSPIVNQTNTLAYRERVKDRNNLRDDVHVLEIQLKEQEKILGDYGKPKGLWGGLLVLIYACAVGIAYPTILLPYPTEVYDDILTKWVLIGLFFSELLALFIYLAVAMYKLTKQKF